MVAADPSLLAARLEPFTTDELLSEVARRARELAAQVNGEELCEGCRHQVFWKSTREPPPSFNPCALRHKLEFKMPEDWLLDEGGYYRPGGCKDRVIESEPPAQPRPSPPPAPRPPPGSGPTGMHRGGKARR